MPVPRKVLHAEIREISLKSHPKEINKNKTLKVQFNPETLKVNYANQSGGGDQRGGSAKQFIGVGTTKLSVELWFDVTGPLQDGVQENDVRKLTEKVQYFIKPKPIKRKKKKKKFLPPGVRFIWGTFLFDGIMDSMDENLEYFSEDGKPLRASVSISLSSQEIFFKFGDQGFIPDDTPGISVQTQAKPGEPFQKVTGKEGKERDWKKYAIANDVENPRHMDPGKPLDLN